MELDLEKQYSPSLFTKRFQNANKPNEEVINNFINVSTRGNNKVLILFLLSKFFHFA